MKWPKNDREIVQLKDITSPICRAIRFAFNLNRRNTTKDIPWDGLDTAPSMAAMLPPVESSLSLNGLKRARECDFDTLEAIVAIAVQMGIEQGRRMTKRRGEGLLKKEGDRHDG